MNIEIDFEDVRGEVVAFLSRMAPQDIVAFFKEVDAATGDWELIGALKPWVDEQWIAKLTEDVQERQEQGLCWRDPVTEEEYHQDPHQGCILR